MLQHIRHKHSPVLEENYHAKKRDVCRGCNQKIVSCKSFVYSCMFSSITASSTSDVDEECVKFLLHRTCAELPSTIEYLGQNVHFGCTRVMLMLLLLSKLNFTPNTLLPSPILFHKSIRNLISILDSAMKSWISSIGCTFVPNAEFLHIFIELDQIQRRGTTSLKYCEACGSDFIGCLRYRCGKYCDFYAVWSQKQLNTRGISSPPSLDIWTWYGLGPWTYDFKCEFCFGDIDTNLWFYHCSDCDLSLHIRSCFEISSSFGY